MGSDSTHMTAFFAYRGVNLVCQTDCHAGLTRDFYCPKSAGEAKAGLHRAQPWATDGPIPKLALQAWVRLVEGAAMPWAIEAMAFVISLSSTDTKDRGHE